MSPKSYTENFSDRLDFRDPLVILIFIPSMSFFFLKKQRLGLLLNKTFFFYLDQGPSLIIQKEDFIFQFPITQANSIPLPVTICFLILFFNGEILFEFDHTEATITQMKDF